MSTAGYSGTPLAKKLGIKPETGCCCSTRPTGFALEGVQVVRRATGLADVILSFHTERRDLERRLPVLRERMEQAGAAVDRLAEEGVQGRRPTSPRTSSATSLWPTRSWTTKSRRIDEIWSGLQLVIRVKDRLP